MKPLTHQTTRSTLFKAQCNNALKYAKPQSGFTLIELVIVITIIAIFSSIAVSTFSGYTASADRAQAQADLHEIAQTLERGFTEKRDYSQVTGSASNQFNVRTFKQVGPDPDPDRRYDFFVGPNINTSNGNTAGTTTYIIFALAIRTRDSYELALGETGVEYYRSKGTAAWTTGEWDAIPD